MKKIKGGLLTKIVLAILSGILCGMFFPMWASRIMATFNSIFSNLLGFVIAILILGLVAPSIAELGRGAGRLLAITALLAYLFTVFSGLFTYGVCALSFSRLFAGDSLSSSRVDATTPEAYFTIEMPPVMGVMSALVLAFILGLGLSLVKGSALKEAMNDFRDIITLVINKVIIPLLPIYIFGIFLLMTTSGQVAGVIGVFIKLIAVIFVMTVVLLVLQFSIAGAVAGKNPFRLLRTMMTAYLTALGTQSSAATIPVTLEQTVKNGVRPQIAGFVIPLCATIHLSGSTMKITACALAIMMIEHIPADPMQYIGFILMLGITMIAAPGIPGGAIMAAAGLLQSMLGFDQTAVGLMIALYIAMDSFGTATNVTGDGAIAIIVDKIADSDSTLRHNR